MGITGELVKSVFSRTGRARSGVAVDKRRWGSVRSYLCGDEFNSVLAEEDSASVKSSEATVTQPMPQALTEKEDFQSEEMMKRNRQEEKHNSISELFDEEDAAIVIQTAFRRFLAKRQSEEEIKSNDDKIMQKEPLTGPTQSPGRESVGTSVEVQTGNSVEVLSFQEESMTVLNRAQQKPRAQILKKKEDWDDSTVSSDVSKMRIQNRLEAMTRRERAMAYAFSQQLRICSKRKQTKSCGMERNMSWSWLERWMATRVPECSLVENHPNMQLETFNITNLRFDARKRSMDSTGEERESCGSNEVPVQCDGISVSTPKGKNSYKSPKNRVKAARSISRRKTVPSYQLS